MKMRLEMGNLTNVPYELKDQSHIMDMAWTEREWGWGMGTHPWL
jgi:hypothetical protein